MDFSIPRIQSPDGGALYPQTIQFNFCQLVVALFIRCVACRYVLDYHPPAPLHTLVVCLIGHRVVVVRSIPYTHKLFTFPRTSTDREVFNMKCVCILSLDFETVNSEPPPHPHLTPNSPWCDVVAERINFYQNCSKTSSFSLLRCSTAHVLRIFPRTFFIRSPFHSTGSGVCLCSGSLASNGI